MKKSFIRNLLLASGLCATLLTSGCASQDSVKLNIHTDPEGAHVIYRQGQSHWLYLGVTPLNVIEVIQKEELEDEDTVSIKTMRTGYLDQVREYSGREIRDELAEQGHIFWTPRLVKAPKK